MIVYQQSIAGMMNTKTIDTLQIQSDSTFTLTLPVEDYERVNFILYGKAVLGSVISKGGKIQLDVDATAQEPLAIQGVDEKAVAVSRLLNRLNAAVWDLRARRGDRWQIAKDTVATSVAQKLKDDAVSLESQLTGWMKTYRKKPGKIYGCSCCWLFRTRRWVLFIRHRKRQGRIGLPSWIR